MAQNNLRIVYNNLTDVPGTTVTVSSTSAATTVVANLISDYKSLIWKTATSSASVDRTAANIKATFTNASIVGAVILAFNNLKAGATARITGYTGTFPVLTGSTDVPTFTTTGSALIFDTGFVDVNRPAGLDQFEWGLEELAPLGNEVRKGYSVVWVPRAMHIPVTSIIVEVLNADNTDTYIEVSRLIIGNYWCPKYNTSFGLSANLTDTSSSERSEAGDLITINGISYPTLSFDLEYLDIHDKTEYNRLIKKRGKRYPLFVSLFPEDADPVKEQMHQIYGKLVQLPGITNHLFDMYNTQVEIEEI